MEAYKLFVRKNREFVHSLESLANGITWLLPERFSNSEIGPEAVYALLGIISTVNQHIIDTSPTKLRPPALGDSTFPWSLFVSMLKDAETVVEVAAEHFVGEKHKWNYLVLTEAVKAFVRLAAFRDSGYKILLQGGEIVNSDERVSEDYNRRLGDARMVGGSNRPGYIHERAISQNLEGRAISALSCFGENAKLLSDQVWLNNLRHGSQTAVAKQTLSTLWFQKGLSGQLFLSGEVLSILRPLIYVLFIRRCGIQSWKPWLISLAIDLAGMSFLSFSTNSQPRNGDNYYHLSSSEKDEASAKTIISNSFDSEITVFSHHGIHGQKELACSFVGVPYYFSIQKANFCLILTSICCSQLKRRKLVWALYIMRDPFFSKYTKHRLEKTDKYLSQVPFIGFLTAKLVELIVGAQTRYTYTSGS